MAEDTDSIVAAVDSLSSAVDAQVTRARRAVAAAAELAEEFRQRTGVEGGEPAPRQGAADRRDHPQPRSGDDDDDFSQERIVF